MPLAQIQPAEAHRVEVDIAGDLLPAGVIFDDHRAKAALEEVTRSVVPPIKPDTVADVEPLHGTAQVGARCFDEQMIVVIHQHIGVDTNREALGGLRQQFEEVSAIGLLPVDRLSLIASRRDVVTSAGPFDTQCSCHDRYGRAEGGESQC